MNEHPSHAYSEAGQSEPIVSRFQFRDWATARGVPYKELPGDRLRCLDLSQCPPIIRELFDSNGLWIEEVSEVADEVIGGDE